MSHRAGGAVGIFWEADEGTEFHESLVMDSWVPSRHD